MTRERVSARSATQALLQQQESLRSVIESISGELELRPLLTRIVRHACELIGADDGTIGLLQSDRNVIRTEAIYRMPEAELGTEMGPGIGLAGQVLLAGEPIVLRRYGDIPSPVWPALADNAVIGMPIAWKGRMIGFFGIGRSPAPGPGRRAKPFTAHDVEALAVFARHAAIAIENARLFEQANRRTERLELIARVAQIIAADLRIGELLQRAADAVHELLGYPNVAIPLISPADPNTLVLNTVGGHYRSIIKGEYRLPTREGIMGEAARTMRVVRVNDVHSDARYLPTPGASGINAELAVPILLGNRVLGVLNVESSDPFDRDDEASLKIVADQLAVAIENARLYEQAQQVAVLRERERLSRELHDSVTQLLFSVTLIAQSVGPAWERDPAEGRRRVDRLLELSRSALAEMRVLLTDLRSSNSGPTQLPSIGIARMRRDGLAGALYQLGSAIAVDGVQVTVDATGYRPLPRPEEEALYRIAQEALSNALKHARARHVVVRMSSDPASTTMVVRDDGAGLAGGASGPVIESGGSGGMGLLTMRERAEALGGTLRIVTAPGAGTSVEVVLPRKPEGAA